MVFARRKEPNMLNMTNIIEMADSSRDIGVGSYLLFIGTVGGLCNVVVLTTYLRTPKSLDPTSLLLISLASSDLGILVLCPFSAASTFGGRWLFGDVGCQAYAFVGFLFGSAHIGTLTLLALDRYLATCRIGFRSNPTFKRYLQLILLVWLYGLFWAVMPLLGWGRYGIEPSLQSCTIDWRHNDASYKSFTLVYFVLGFLVPACIVLVCYRTSAVRIRAPKPKTVRRDVPDDFWASEESVTVMVTLIVVTFFFAWTPYAMLCLWAVFADAASVPHLLALVPPLFAKTASAVNPFIYFLSNPKIRADVLRLLGCRAEATPFANPSNAVEEERCCQGLA